MFGTELSKEPEQSAQASSVAPSGGIGGLTVRKPALITHSSNRILHAVVHIWFAAQFAAIIELMDTLMALYELVYGRPFFAEPDERVPFETFELSTEIRKAAGLVATFNRLVKKGLAVAP